MEDGPTKPCVDVSYLPHLYPVNTKHLHNIYTTSTLIQHCINIIHMFCVLGSPGRVCVVYVLSDSVVLDDTRRPQAKSGILFHH